ncbi:YicC/YloC family endoribonuclease [Clostridium minihomine]|uniref:YicC/YloC family endoribonuclease n=1 Tax=Clostridium minihomine TaxID=2045012 RepID=UPI000C78FB2F|nr:YicC/YloC family endoribonuclease [Clostridium minihomine]
MIKSMTGYGRAEGTLDGRYIIVEIKSVNHRYFEFNSKVTRGYSFLDEKLKSYLQKRISRGKVDVFVSIETLQDADAQVLVNHSVAAGYLNALKELRDTYGLKDDITVMGLSRYSDIFTVHRTPEDEDQIWASVSQIAEQAMEQLLQMRELEGSRLKADIARRAGTIISLVDAVEERSPVTVQEYQQKLLTRLLDLLHDSNIEEQRVLTEAAIFADKIAVAEETVRLRSHFDQLNLMLESSEAIGRKLDFLVQEMNRETNTIGSKASDSQIAYMVVDMKAEIEKIREQIQNIE